MPNKPSVKTTASAKRGISRLLSGVFHGLLYGAAVALVMSMASIPAHGSDPGATHTSGSPAADSLAASPASPVKHTPRKPAARKPAGNRRSLPITDSLGAGHRPETPTPSAPTPGDEVVLSRFSVVDGDSVSVEPVDTIPVIERPVNPKMDYDEWYEKDMAFNPDPQRAVWLSALFPGLGQIYNRRYWKLPIIVGGYLGLGYACSWNNSQLTDYNRAYRDIMDTDPNTNSYMDFFPPTTSEDSIDKTWLKNLLKSRKNYFRRNRDLCIIGMVGVYLLAMVDAYVDASLSHFDVTPDISMDVSPAVFQDSRGGRPSFGLLWALTF